MRFGVGVLALLVAATAPALLFAGATTLRGLGWLVVLAVGAVLLIDLGDRFTEWGRAAPLGPARPPPAGPLRLGRDALRRRARGVGEADVLQQQAHEPHGGDREELRGVQQ
jgi:hypothetical protein